VSQHVEHAIERKRPACIDLRDAASGDGRGDNTAVDEIGSAEFAAYCAEPVTFARPSTREVGVPI
jgi:hypothetical protein